MFIGLFFNGFLEKIGTATDRAIISVITVGGSIGGFIVAVMAIVAVVVVLAVVCHDPCRNIRVSTNSPRLMAELRGKAIRTITFIRMNLSEKGD